MSTMNKTTRLPPRPDGRSDNTLRPLTCELSCLENCDGSVLWKAGGTHVVASVHGPIAPSQPHHEWHDKCRIQVLIKQQQQASISSAPCSEWEALLTNILTSCCITEQYPRSVVQVTLLVESADGSVLAAAVHAAVGALMDAGIEMRYLPTAVTCLASRQQDSGSTISSSSSSSHYIRLDPCHAEEQYKEATVLVLVLAGGNDPDQILACHTPTSATAAEQQLDINTVLQCVAATARASQAIVAFWRLAMESKVQREAQTLWSS